MAYSEQKAGKNSESQGHAEARPSRSDLHGEGRASARPQWKWRVERRLASQGGQPRPAQKEQTGRLACGRRPTLKTMKTAPRTWKEGGKADVQSGDGRPARGASGKRETSGMTPSPLQKRGGGGGRESPGRVLVVWTARAAGSPTQEPSQKPERFFLVPVRGKESTPTRFCVGCQATQWCGLAAVRRTCHVDCVLQMNNEVIIADFTRDVRESEILTLPCPTTLGIQK